MEAHEEKRTAPAGVGVAVAAAVLFGASTPFAKLLLGQLPPVLLAGLLYLGSGLGPAPTSRGWQERPFSVGSTVSLEQSRDLFNHGDFGWVLVFHESTRARQDSTIDGSTLRRLY
jgi:hypothetical protein